LVRNLDLEGKIIPRWVKKKQFAIPILV